MKNLSYQTLKEQGYEGYLLEKAPERVLQFGEGNFLRAFVDYFIDLLNEKEKFNGKVVLVQPIAQGMGKTINDQDGLFTLYLRGFTNGQKVNRKRIVSCISRCINPYDEFQAYLDCAYNPDLRFIASNTTEAGIAFSEKDRFDDIPPKSFPGKLTRFLFERFTRFGTVKGKGFVILSCELIDDNGIQLKKCVDQYIELWHLGDDFAAWIRDENIFCSTLVDRIVTGYPRNETDTINAENGYEDKLLDTAEVFGFWVIEGPKSLEEELPFKKAGLPVLITDDHTPYKMRKVRILNGAHTSMVLAAYLSGQNIVRGCIEDEEIHTYMNKIINEEIIPTLSLPKDELEEFAAAVMERFNNPFIDHRLLDISLNSVSKWRARVLPSLLGYIERFHKLPELLCFSLAALIQFYSSDDYTNGVLTGTRGSDLYLIRDDESVLKYFASNSGTLPRAEFVAGILSRKDFWGMDLTQIEGMTQIIVRNLDEIERIGMKHRIADLLK